MNFAAAPRRVLHVPRAFIITPQRQLVKFANTAWDYSHDLRTILGYDLLYKKAFGTSSNPTR